MRGSDPRTVGPGSEGGEKLCFIKFAAARAGDGVGERFSRLLDACDLCALSRGVPIEAGVNLAHEDAGACDRMAIERPCSWSHCNIPTPTGSTVPMCT